MKNTYNICFIEFVGQKIQYNFGNDNDFRIVTIEKIKPGFLKFKNITGFWPISNKYIECKSKKSKIITGFTGNLATGFYNYQFNT
jgi:hypothetical protein